MDTRPVLGLPALRPPLLVDLSTSRSRKTETSHGTRIVTQTDNRAAFSKARGPEALFTIRFELEDDLDDDLDEDDDDDEGEGEGEGEDEEDGEDDDEDVDTETWQVSSARRFR